MSARDSRPAANGAAQDTTGQVDTAKSNRAYRQSQQVNWRAVHRFVTPLLQTVGSWPTVGTIEWHQLHDDDLVKYAALFDAAQHWALRLESCQVARCEAGRAISAGAPLVDDDLLSLRTKPAVDWKSVAQEIRRRREAHIYRVVE